MAKYLLEVNYTLDEVREVRSAGGSARLAAATELVEGLGGTIESFYFAFGDTDVHIIADLPDNAAAAAASLAVSAGGGSNARIVVLLTPAELDAAADRQTTYRPPND
ncbi:MAG TPA: GYD domain-containing protein [Acidimicrobiales bacterium]|nr:GYD domain-containing protein [Acidimicrobiales bacterium]